MTKPRYDAIRRNISVIFQVIKLVIILAVTAYFLIVLYTHPL